MKSAGLSKVSKETRGWKTLLTCQQQFTCKGNNEEHEKATKPSARSDSHPQPMRHTSPCLHAICGFERRKKNERHGSIL